MSAKYAEHLNPKAWTVMWEGQPVEVDYSTDVGKMLVVAISDANFARNELRDALEKIATVAAQQLDSLKGGWSIGDRPLQGYEANVNEKAQRFDLLSKHVRQLAKIAGIELEK